MDFDNIFEGLKENKKTLIIALVLIITIIVVSILNLILDNGGDKVDMKGILNSFAGIYYEEYYYPEVKRTNGNNYLEQLKKDADEGIVLTLREIISNFEDIDATKFYQDGNYCDDLRTHVIIYPEYPYDINDYKTKIEISCEKEINGD